MLNGPPQGPHKCGGDNGPAKDSCISCRTRKDICAILNTSGGRAKIVESVISKRPQAVAGRAFDLKTEHDTAEFRMLLLSRLREDCLQAVPDAAQLDPDSKDTTLIDAIFGGKSLTTLQCACGVATRRTTYAMDLVVNVTKGKGPVPLDDLIRESMATETIEGYKCDNCGQNRTVTKTTRIQDPGANFTVQIGRWDPFTGSKRSRRVQFPEHLDLAPYLAVHKKAKYRLYAVTHHHGMSLKMGHYTASVRRPDGRWVYCDDATVRHTTIDQVLNEQSTAYTLHYQRMDTPDIQSQMTTPAGGKKRKAEDEIPTDLAKTTANKVRTGKGRKLRRRGKG
ncbi:hypothetical protein HDU86_004297 [Geranomyces michiganensis]|nr:hypothetical protein HDU86_004297 [Geranomyces michiganensis]